MPEAKAPLEDNQVQKRHLFFRNGEQKWQIDAKNHVTTLVQQMPNTSTFCLAAFVVRLQVEVRIAGTDVGARCVQADVFADRVGHFITFIDVHTGQGAGVQPEPCSTRAPLQEENNKKGTFKINRNEFNTRSRRLNVDIQLINNDTATGLQAGTTQPPQLGTDRAFWGADAVLFTPRG